MTFAESWIAAWNARDVEAVLAHFAEDVVFTSPTAVEFAPGSHGIVRGKSRLRRYWTAALAQKPDLRHTLDGVYAGVDTLVLHYRDETGSSVAEVLTFRHGLVAVGHATHLASDHARRGA
jgi:ketosteroid isomerase-like protein